MKIQEATILPSQLFEVTAHGHYYVNPYFGCSEGCPFCYWPALPGWEGQITARTNIVEVFDAAMASWDNSRRVCFGSYCNPYEAIERRFRLTRGLLEVCKARNIPFLLATSSDGILEDLELLTELRDQAILVFELARIPRLTEFARTGRHSVVDAANTLSRRGIRVIATLSPYLPGITDAERLLEALDADIPLYLGALDLETNWSTAARLLPQIYLYRPELLDRYGWLVRDNHAQEEFERYMTRFTAEPRIRRFPLEVDYGDQ